MGIHGSVDRERPDPALVTDADLVARIYMQKLAVVFALRSKDAVSIAPWQAGGNVEALVDDEELGTELGKDLHVL
jgi:hypothetical protein